jgi:prepilin-type N-terminal cleavage/methylation domain-containing protein
MIRSTGKHIRNQKGFTLVELLMCFAIVGILASIGSTYFLDIRKRSGDAQAFSEGRNLMTAVSDAFLGLEDIDFDTNPDGVTGNLGTVQFSDGGARPSIFHLSGKIRARLSGQSTPQPGGGFLIAEIWNTEGTEDGTSESGKKEYYYEIQEDGDFLSLPTL